MNRKNAAFKIRSFDLDVKAVSESGVFTGYGSVFGVVDSYNEVVAPGAFKASLEELAASGRAIPILWQHRTGEPIGAWTSLKEDARGLLGDGELWLLVVGKNGRVTSVYRDDPFYWWFLEKGRNVYKGRNQRRRNGLKSRVDELDELRKLPQKEVLQQVLVGWSGLLDENNGEVFFNETNIAALLAIPQAFAALTEAFWASIFKAKEKN